MSKTLTLKSRMSGNWHDAVILVNALETLVTGKSFAKAAMWLAMAGRVQVALEAAQDGVANGLVGDVSIELSSTEAKVLGKEIVKLPVESFAKNAATGRPTAPPVGTFFLAMCDWAAELGFTLPEADLEDDSDSLG